MSEEHLTAEEQAQLDAMRDDDAQTGSDQTPAADPAAAQQPPIDPAQPSKQRDDRVPYAALSEERQTRKRVETELQAERDRSKILEERTNLLLQRFGQPQQQPAEQRQQEPPKPEIPALDKDPVGHIVGTQQEFARQLAQQNTTWQQQQNQLQQHLQAQQIVTALTQRAQALEADFTREHADYGAAVQHLTAQRHKELELIGFTDPVRRHQVIQQEGLGLAAESLQAGRNPAAAIYELAKMRGFSPPDPNGDAGAGTGSRPQPTAEQRLQNIAAGQQQARSLGAARGTGPTTLTAQSLAAMSDKDFAKMLETEEGMAMLGA